MALIVGRKHKEKTEAFLRHIDSIKPGSKAPVLEDVKHRDKAKERSTKKKVRKQREKTK